MSRLSSSLVLLSAFLCLGGSFSSLQAASPSFTSLAPRGGQRGTEAVVTFAGQRLADAQEVVVYYPGITAGKPEAVTETSFKVTLKIAPDCRLGEHLFRVRTATGLSDARTFWVGALPVVNEVEPNSEFDKPQAVPLNCTVHGGIGGEDVDYYVVECKKGQRLSAELEGMRLGLSFWDPYIAILNEKRFELVTSDDTPLTGQDPGCSIVVPADGKYVVMVREAAFGGGNQYRLHVGTFPRPTAAVPAGGKPGETIEVRFVGDPLGEVRQKVTLPAADDPNFRIHCETKDGIAPTGFPCRVIDLPNVIETGANTTVATAQPGPYPAAFHGVVAKPGETRFVKFPVKKGQVLELKCFARQLGSPIDTVLAVYQPDGKVLAQNDDVGRTSDSGLRFTAPDDRDLVVGVHDQLRKGGPDYFFRLEVAPPALYTTVNLPKADVNNVANQERQTIVVPRGGRYAMMLTTQRAGWGGHARFEFAGLPAGVTATGHEVNYNQGPALAVFEAAADAPLAGTLGEVRFLPVDEKLSARSLVTHDIPYSIGGNNQPYHRHVTSRFAFAIAEEAPFAIEVVPPTCPIPRGATYQLKVVATRTGYDGPIRVTPAFAPPGFGMPPSMTIEAGATVGYMTVNAAGNSNAGWKMAMNASADTARGVVWTGSRVFGLGSGPPLATFAQGRAAVDQGGNTTVFGKLTVDVPFTGEATAALLALPNKATAPAVKVTAATQELSFAVATDKATPAGKQQVFAQITAVVNGETFVQNVGGAELRVDVPLPPKANTPTPPGTPPATPTAGMPAAKPLSRLEQLRKEQEEREKAEKKEEPKK